MTETVGKKNGLWTYVYMPIIYILLLAILLAMVVLPYRSALFETLAMLSSEQNHDNAQLTNMFGGKKDPPVLPTEPGIDEPEPVSVPLSEITVPDYNALYGFLTCSRLEIDCPLYFGDSKAALRNGAGQYMGSYLPGFGGTILVAGHNTTFFRPLENVQIGDQFTVYTNYGAFLYRVRETKVLDHNDPSAFSLSSRDKEELVLYTCYPFERMAAVKTDRLFVYCEKIAGPVVQMTEGA